MISIILITIVTIQYIYMLFHYRSNKLICSFMILIMGGGLLGMIANFEEQIYMMPEQSMPMILMLAWIMGWNFFIYELL